VTSGSVPAGGLSNMRVLSHARILDAREYAYIYRTFRISSNAL
jgi:hypothetical protein